MLLQKFLVCEKMGWTFDEYDEADFVELSTALALYDGYKAGLEQRQKFNKVK